MGTLLSDTDKFKMVFAESNLNQTRFSNKIGITPGSLSGILNGRTKPTIALFRSFIQAFPNINPMWLFGTDENMHVDGTAVVSSAQNVDSMKVDSFDVSSLDETSFDFGELGKSAAMSAAHQSTPSNVSPAPKFVSPVEQSRGPVSAEQKTRMRQTVAPSHRQPVQQSIPSSVLSSVPSSMPNSLPNEMIASMALSSQKPPRQITEIRIFFDDGTYETFGPR